VLNSWGLWLYLSDVNSITKQLEELEEMKNCKCEDWSKKKKKEITRKINNNLNVER